jgi:hypothetical protein
MSLRPLGAALVLCLGVSAQSGVTVQKVKEFIHSAIEQKLPDKEVAAAVRALKLSERLDDRIIEELRRDGAGPKTVAAMKELAAKSSGLPAAKPPAPKIVYVAPPPPSNETQAKIVDAAREQALTYTDSLPDYICSQVTRRFVDPAGGEAWQATDVLLARLTYFQKKEDYKLVTVNNTVTTDKPYTSVGGAISQGEFGTMMRGLFDPQSNAEFRWERWATVHGRASYVFSYTVPLAHSQYTIHHQGSATDKGQTITAGYHGSVFIDLATSRVLRISLEADNIPADFPVHQAGEVLNYDFVKIGDSESLLPSTAEFHSLVDHAATKNVVEFHNYRKFSADAKFIVEDTDAPPPNDDKGNEQAPKQQ